MDIHLPVVEMQRFSIHDGPGVRTTVFLKGCPLRCEWCHNPETQSGRPQILYSPENCVHCGACAITCAAKAHVSDHGKHFFEGSRCHRCLRCADVCSAKAIEPVGKAMTVSEIMDLVMKDSAFYGRQGGVTLSGGEPLLHWDGCLALLTAAKERGLSTAVETCGYFDAPTMEDLTRLVDLFLWDYKDGNAERHKRYTGVSNNKIINNLLCADKTANRIVLRCIMVKGVNMDEENYCGIVSVYSKLSRCNGVELIPYHPYGGSKNKRLGYYDNGNSEWVPTADDMENAREMLYRISEVLCRDKFTLIE